MRCVGAIHFDNSFSVDKEGRSSEVTIMWRNKLNCQITSFSINYIDVEMQDVNVGN